jgi:CheY-like chemotaxis protein
MEKAAEPLCILIAEDNEDDYLLARDALKECNPEIDLRWVKDGEDLMDYLLHRGVYKDSVEFPLPNLLLLDLSMPRKNGREALKEIRALPGLRRLPIVVLTTSHSEEDILFSYDQGANSFISKPIGFEPFVQVMRSICGYWFGHTALPPVDIGSK